MLFYNPDGSVAVGFVLEQNRQPVGQSNPLIVCPSLQQDLIGNLNTPSPGRARGFTAGRALVVNNAYVDLWGGLTPQYVFPVVPQQMAIASSSGSDSASGTGIQQVLIHYLDANYNTQTEIVTTSGVTPVLTGALNILRINGIHAYRVGSSGAAAGNISLSNIGQTVTYGFIGALETGSQQAIYTVPAGMTGYINHWQSSSGSSGAHFCEVELQATCHDGVFLQGIFIMQDAMGSQNNGQSVTFPTPIPIPERSDVRLRAISDAVNANVRAIGAIMGWFEPIPI